MAVAVAVAMMVCSFDGRMERESNRYFSRELRSTTGCVFLMIHFVYEYAVCFLAEAGNDEGTKYFYRALCAIYTYLC